MSLRYINRFPAKLAIAFKNRPLSSSLRSFEPERLLIQIPEQMKRLNVYIRSLQRALEQRPKVFQGINMNVSLGVRDRMINHLVRVFVCKFVVGTELVGDKLRTFFHVCSDFRIKVADTRALNYLAANTRRFVACFALQKSEHSRFADHAPLSRFPVFVHETCSAADVSFIRFHATGKLFNRAVLHRQTDTVQHEPACFLGDAQRASKFARANSVLRVDDHPRCGKPFVESQGTILKDRSDFDAELFLARLAVPNSAGQHELANVSRVAARATNTARPTHPYQKLMALVGIAEITNRARQGFGNVI